MTDEPQRPTTGDRTAWQAYWRSREMTWRWEPEITPQRQAWLAARLASPGNEHSGPFHGLPLMRADVEWLLAQRGVMDWYPFGPGRRSEDQVRQEGLDLRGVDLHGQDLTDLHLDYVALAGANLEAVQVTATTLRGNLAGVFLSRATLIEAATKLGHPPDGTSLGCTVRVVPGGRKQAAWTDGKPQTLPARRASRRMLARALY